MKSLYKFGASKQDNILEAWSLVINYFGKVCIYCSLKKLSKKTSLIEKEEIVTDDSKIVDTFNIRFCNTVRTLHIEQNKTIICDAIDYKDQMLWEIKKSKKHSSILR